MELNTDVSEKASGYFPAFFAYVVNSFAAAGSIFVNRQSIWPCDVSNCSYNVISDGL